MRKHAPSLRVTPQVTKAKDNHRANDGVELIAKITGKGKLVDLTPAELAKVMEAIDGAQ